MARLNAKPELFVYTAVCTAKDGDLKPSDCEGELFPDICPDCEHCDLKVCEGATVIVPEE